MSCTKGASELPKAARGHATYIDGKVLLNIEFKFGLYKHVNRRSAPAPYAVTFGTYDRDG